MALLNSHQHPFRDLFVDAGSALRPGAIQSDDGSYRPVVTVLVRVCQLAQPPHRSTQSINDRLDVWAHDDAIPAMRAILESHLAQFPALKGLPWWVRHWSVAAERTFESDAVMFKVRLRMSGLAPQDMAPEDAQRACLMRDVELRGLYGGA